MSRSDAHARDLDAAENLVLSLGDFNEPLLLVDDPFAADLLHGHTVHHWHRMTHGDQPGSLTPPDIRCSLCAIRLSKSKPAFQLALTLAAHRLEAGATIYLYGQNDEGIRSVDSPLLRDLETVLTRRHGRVWKGVLATEAQGSLDDALARACSKSTIKLENQELTWRSYPGLFAKGELDAATALLLDTTRGHNLGRHILDYGCGTGVIARALAMRDPAARIDALDPDAFALAATAQNAPKARRFPWTSLAKLQDRYDTIISNPPIHSGKSNDLSVLQALCRDAYAHLTDNGALILVTQRQVPLDRIAPKELKLALIEEDSRYRIWRLAR